MQEQIDSGLRSSSAQEELVGASYSYLSVGLSITPTYIGTLLCNHGLGGGIHKERTPTNFCDIIAGCSMLVYTETLQSLYFPPFQILEGYLYHNIQYYFPYGIGVRCMLHIYAQLPRNDNYPGRRKSCNMPNLLSIAVGLKPYDSFKYSTFSFIVQ